MNHRESIEGKEESHATSQPDVAIGEVKRQIDAAFGLWIDRGDDLGQIATSMRPGMGHKFPHR